MFISVLLISVFLNSVKTIYLIYDTDRLKQCIALIPPINYSSINNNFVRLLLTLEVSCAAVLCPGLVAHGLLHIVLRLLVVLPLAAGHQGQVGRVVPLVGHVQLRHVHSLVFSSGEGILAKQLSIVTVNHRILNWIKTNLRDVLTYKQWRTTGSQTFLLKSVTP